MRFTDYLALAMRRVRRSRLRSALTVGAIVIGATGITIMLTFVTSVKHYVVQKFEATGEARQLQVAPQANLEFNSGGTAQGGGGGATGQQIVLTPALEQQIRSLPGVDAVAAVAQRFGGTFQYVTIGGHQLSADRMVGVEANGVVQPPLVAGRAFRTGDTGAVVLLANDFVKAAGLPGPDALVGQTVVFHTHPGWTGGPVDKLPTALPPQQQCQPNQRQCFGGPTSGLPATDLPATVIGVVASEHDQGVLYVPVDWLVSVSNEARPHAVRYAQSARPGQPGQPSGPPSGPGTVEGGWDRATDAEVLTQRGGYDSFTVVAHDVGGVAQIADGVRRLGLNSATGLDQLHKQEDTANAIGLVLGALGLVALLIAALGIMNTMVMSVLERTREIGVMRAVGARRSTIRRLFTFEAATLGFLGGLLGVGIGYVFVFVGKAAIRNAISSSSDITQTNFAVPLWLVVVVIAGTTAIGTLAGLIPSRRAARLDPVDALRYE